MSFKWSRWFALVGVVALSGCAHLQSLVEPPQVRVLSVDPVFITTQSIGFKAKLNVVNKIPVRIPLDKMMFHVVINGKTFTTGSLDSVAAIGGSASQIVEVPFQIDFSEMIALVVNVQKAERIHLQFNGKLYVGSQFSFPAIPFGFKTVLPVPRLPKVEFGGFDLMHQEKNIGLKIKVDNPNTFPLIFRESGIRANIGGDTYSLAGLKGTPVVAAGKKGVVFFKIGDSIEKTARLFMSLLVNPNKKITFTGKLESDTPFGRLAIPIGSK